LWGDERRRRGREAARRLGRAYKRWGEEEYTWSLLKRDHRRKDNGIVAIVSFLCLGEKVQRSGGLAVGNKVGH